MPLNTGVSRADTQCSRYVVSADSASVQTA
jgi:hypothetical protein